MRLRVDWETSTLNGLGALFCASIERLKETGNKRSASRRVIVRESNTIKDQYGSENRIRKLTVTLSEHRVPQNSGGTTHQNPRGISGTRRATPSRTHL